MKYEELVKTLKDNYGAVDASSVNEHVALQFNVTGEAEGAFYVEIADGKVNIEPYEYYDRDVLVTVSETDLIDVFDGKLDFIEAFNDGRIKAEGNLIKALALKDLIEKNAGVKKSALKKAKSVVATAKAAKKAVATKKEATKKEPAKKETVKKETVKKTATKTTGKTTAKK